MGITYDKSNQTFHIQTNDTSYIIQVTKFGYLSHLYWGRRLSLLSAKNLQKCAGVRAFTPTTVNGNHSFSLDTLPQEYPTFGSSDFRHPAIQIQHKDGSTVSEFKYKNYRIFDGKPLLTGLPATYTETDEEAQTLEIELFDELVQISVILSYTVFKDIEVLTRSARIINHGDGDIKLLRALSIGIDFNDSDYELLHLQGAWGRERHIERNRLLTGSQKVESRRGASSHMHNPFIALTRKNSDESNGEVYGFSLVYSGSFVAEAEVDQFKTTRITMGINHFDFSWLLTPEESFQTPEVVMVYSAGGIGGMSRIYHKLYRTRLCRGTFKNKIRPVLVNNWEATYFNFDAAKIESIAASAKELGIELFVLDDGWFGKRNNDHTSLGDWFVNEEKLPGGLEKLVKNINEMGLQFGLWFEPEMISPESELYKSHPDWCLHVAGRNRTEARNQLVLDYSRQEVCNALIKMVSDVLSSAPITYVKWDMNRSMTEVGSAGLPPERQRETAHRYMLGLYRVLETITQRFPNILFESCSGGGGRFDPGMLYYMPQTWTSDDTDAVERLKIQYGTSIVYPVSSMGSHVSTVPNHQVGRTTPLKMRGDVAMSGNFGYELDLSKVSDADKQIMKDQVAQYKEIRKLVQTGDFYRLLSPFEGNDTAWMFVSEDKTQAIAAFFRVLSNPNSPHINVRLDGLNPDYLYSISGREEPISGAELMYAGLSVIEEDSECDFFSVVWKLRKV